MTADDAAKTVVVEEQIENDDLDELVEEVGVQRAYELKSDLGAPTTLFFLTHLSERGWSPVNRCLQEEYACYSFNAISRSLTCMLGWASDATKSSFSS